MSTLVLIRHAQVVRDPALPVHMWQLSSEGQAAARRIAAEPALRGVDRFFASTEPKALATARALAGDRPVEVASGLHELDRSAARWFDRIEEYKGMVLEILARPEESVRGCEPAIEAQQRIVSAVEGLLAAHPGRRLAVVSHGIVLTLYLSHLLGRSRPDADIWRGIGFPDFAVVDPAEGRLISSFRGPGFYEEG